MAQTIETVYKIWDDESGERIEVGPDRDGLELIEIRYYNQKGECTRDIAFTPEQAGMVQTALGRLLTQEKK